MYLKFCHNYVKIFKGKGQTNYKNIFYLIQYMKNLSMYDQYKIISEIIDFFYAVFLTTVLNFVLAVDPICMLNIQ